MPLHSISRLIPPSFLSKPSKSSTLRFSTSVSAAAERLYTQIQRCPTNLEKELSLAKAKLDSSCINEVIKRCNPNQFQLALRFFVWAGTQSNHRHSPYMYTTVSDILKIRTNPNLIKDLIETYHKEDFFVTVKTLRIVLSLCNKAKLPDVALWVLRKYPRFGLCADTVAYNLVIKLFVERGDLCLAELLMNEMESFGLYPDLITYNAVINGFCNVGKIDEALVLVKEMSKHGCVVNTVTYSRVLEGVCKCGDMERALELLTEMEKGDGGMSPNAVTYTLVIQGFCEKKQIGNALLVLDRMRDRGCSPSRVAASVLIQAVVESDDDDGISLSKLIDKLVKFGGVSMSECFSSVVVSLIRLKKFEEAEKIFRMMLSRRIRPDGVACSLVFKELCFSERFLDCFVMYQEIEKADVKSTINSDIYSVLLLGLLQQGHSSEANKFAKSMLTKKIRLSEKIVEKIKKNGNEDLIRRLNKI